MLFQDKDGIILSPEEVNNMGLAEVQERQVRQFDDWLDY